MTDDWHTRVTAVWDDEALSDDERTALIDELAAERSVGDALDHDHRPQAVIQLASTLRNLDRTDEAIRMLRAELDRDPVSPLRDEAAAFLALSLVSAGDPREAASVALSTLAPHLSRYRRSVASYAAELRDGDA